MWTKNADLAGGLLSWKQALDFIAAMNSGSGTSGHTDWRLPNINEFLSIVDYGQNKPPLPQGHPFLNVKIALYWTSTGSPKSELRAQYIRMDYGVFMRAPLTNTYYVWAVRGGDCGAGADAFICTPKTGLTKSYYPGDDGALQRGVAWPDPRLIDNADGTVTDTLTGLMWTKNANLPNGTKTWQEALDYIVAMNSGTYGYSDWRLPNISELRSLIDIGRYNPALPVGHPFQNVLSGTADYYWSSTFSSGAGGAFMVSLFVSQVTTGILTGSQYVWPVRAGGGSVAHLAVSRQGDGSGAVASNPAGIDCGATCRSLFPMSETVSLSAEPGPLSVFTGWSGACSGTGPCAVTVDASKQVTAEFSIITTTTVDPSTTTSAEVSTTTTTVADSDSDGVPDDIDNCPSVCNPLQLDADNDLIGDLCDATPGCGNGCGTPACEQPCPVTTTTTEPPTSSSTIPDEVTTTSSSTTTSEPPVTSTVEPETTTTVEPSTTTSAEVSTTTTTVGDSDSDGVPDDIDNCPSVCNPLQLDADNDLIGDLCDATPGCGNGCGTPACEQPCVTSTTTSIF